MREVLPPSGKIDLTMEDLKIWPNATLERIRDAILDGRVAAVDDGPDADGILRAAVEDARVAVRAGRMIDAGFLPNAVIRAEANRSKRLIMDGWLRHPFADPYVIFHSWEEGPAPLLVLPDPDGSMRTHVCELIPLHLKHLEMLMIGDVVQLVPEEGAHGPTFRTLARVAPFRIRHARLKEATPEMMKAAACNCGDPVWTVLSMLSTDGVETVTIPEPFKLNKQRARQGRFPIPSRQHIRSGPYVTAILARLAGKPKEPSQGGHHASPVMHIRRGHIRTLATGKRTWVRDCIVNAKDDSPTVRSHYAIKPGKENH